MMEGTREVSGGFGAIDGRLTVFALANSMDLARDPDARRLEWFHEGLERGIRVERGADGMLRVHVAAWPFGVRDGAVERTHAEDVSVDGLPRTLEAAIDAANALILENESS